jgi:hypothetical protein
MSCARRCRYRKGRCLRRKSWTCALNGRCRCPGLPLPRLRFKNLFGGTRSALTAIVRCCSSRVSLQTSLMSFSSKRNEGRKNTREVSEHSGSVSCSSQPFGIFPASSRHHRLASADCAGGFRPRCCASGVRGVAAGAGCVERRHSFMEEMAMKLTLQAGLFSPSSEQ